MSPVKKFSNVLGLPAITAWSREPASGDETAMIKQLGDAAASGEIQQTAAKKKKKKDHLIYSLRPRLPGETP